MGGITEFDKQAPFGLWLDAKFGHKKHLDFKETFIKENDLSGAKSFSEATYGVHKSFRNTYNAVMKDPVLKQKFMDVCMTKATDHGARCYFSTEAFDAFLFEEVDDVPVPAHDEL